MEIRRATHDDIDAVIELQQQYHVSRLSDSEKLDGFVTTAFTREQLQDLIEREQGLFVALDQGQVRAYVMTASWEYWSSWPVQAHMVSIIEQFRLDGQAITLQNSYQYGPICIARSHRGSGLLEALFSFALAAMAARYAILVTFVNKVNARSLNAHIEKLKLQDLGEFECNGNRYAWLACATSAQEAS